MNRQKHVVIVGAGISGLAVAFWLSRKGVHARLLEEESEAGGTIRTVEENDWLVETGPNSVLETTPLFGEMFEALGIAGEKLPANPSSDTRYILRNGRLHPLPMSAPAFIGSRLWSLRGKLRLLQEPFVGRAREEESIADFVKRRLGTEFLDYAINPFVAGVYAGNPEQLSVRAAFPKLYALEEKYGGLLKGMILGRKERKERAEKAKDRAEMFSFVHGMQTFPEAIARQPAMDITFGCRVHSLTRAHGNGAGRDGGAYALGYEHDGRRLELAADAVVLAVPAYAAAQILQPLSPADAGRLDDIYYPPVAEVFLGFKTGQFRLPLDGFGYLIPAKEGRDTLGTIWSSSIFPRRAPQGHVALTTFVGGSRRPELAGRDDRDLIALVMRDIRGIMGVDGEPVFSTVTRWPRAIPQYHLGYHRITEALDGMEENFPGLFFCSNYREGIAVGDCVMSGERTAARVAGFLLQGAQEQHISHSIGA